MAYQIETSSPLGQEIMKTGGPNLPGMLKMCRASRPVLMQRPAAMLLYRHVAKCESSKSDLKFVMLILAYLR